MKFCPQHFDFEHTHTFYYFFYMFSYNQITSVDYTPTAVTLMTPLDAQLPPSPDTLYM